MKKKGFSSRHAFFRQELTFVYVYVCRIEIEIWLHLKLLFFLYIRIPFLPFHLIALSGKTDAANTTVFSWHWKPPTQNAIHIPICQFDNNIMHFFCAFWDAQTTVHFILSISIINHFGIQSNFYTMHFSFSKICPMWWMRTPPSSCNSMLS